MKRWQETIGHTPLVALDRLEPSGRLFAKCEVRNPGGSVKDRAALFMIKAAIADGSLAPGGTIVEPTSGNTGVGLAALGAAMGYPVILTMPDSMSKERRALLSAYGATLILTPGKLGMAGAIERAKQILSQVAGAWMPDQFSNPAGALAHYMTTGPEILEQTGGALDAFVAGVGSGGTITGAGRFLKERHPGLRLIAVEPAESPVLSGGTAAPHGIMGIGAGFVPAVLDRALIDEVVTVSTEEARAMCRRLAAEQGLLCGISSGAAAVAALRLCAAAPTLRVVTLLPDGGERYLSTGLFEQGE